MFPEIDYVIQDVSGCLETKQGQGLYSSSALQDGPSLMASISEHIPVVGYGT